VAELNETKKLIRKARQEEVGPESRALRNADCHQVHQERRAQTSPPNSSCRKNVLYLTRTSYPAFQQKPLSPVFCFVPFGGKASRAWSCRCTMVHCAGPLPPRDIAKALTGDARCCVL
jgi:hypothetical protein